MHADGPNLVLAAAWDIEAADVRPFVESLRRFYRGDVMMLVTSKGSAALVDYLRSREIIPVFFDCQIWMVMQVKLARYVRYGELLRAADKQYARILLTDASDVLFQADPFANLPDDELLCFLEDPVRTIGQCPDDSLWIQQIFGPAILERLKDFEISCSGTTIGTHAAIVQYIDLLLQPAKPNLMAKLMNFRGHDQGIHNYLLRTGALPQARLIPNGEQVYTVGSVKDSDITLASGGVILAPGARACPVVHQFTYKPALLAHVRAAYPSP